VSAQLASLALGLLAGLAFAAITSVALAWSWPHLQGRLAGLHPASRARWIWLAAAAPAALPALLVALCFEPGLLAAAGLGSDHCARHPDHLHLCLSHPSAPLTQAGLGLLLLAAGVLAGVVGPELLRLARTRRWLAQLPRRAQRPAPDVEVFESTAPFAFAAGLRQPRIFLAAGLVAVLPPPQLAAVIEHERAHARRRDPLARLAARVLSFAHLPGLRRRLLRELAIAAEQACDAEAGRRVGDRLQVAEAILAVERILSATAPARTGIVGFEGHSVAERVKALLAAEPAAPGGRSIRITAACAACAVAAGLALADPLHHVTEHFLALVTHLY
jgi:Zn-dependent protease with chaperone function